MTPSEEILAIFGATGSTGKYVLKIALMELDWKVKVMVRTPAKLDRDILQHENLTVVEGDFNNRDSIRQTIKGCTRVICCAGGPHSNFKYPKKFMKKFVKDELWPALQEFKPKSLLLQAGALSKISRLPSFSQIVVAPFMGLYHMAKDNDAVLRFIHTHPLEETQVVCTRPGLLRDAKGGSDLKANQHMQNMKALAFVDLARFNLKAVLDEDLFGKYPYVH